MGEGWREDPPIPSPRLVQSKTLAAMSDPPERNHSVYSNATWQLRGKEGKERKGRKEEKEGQEGRRDRRRDRKQEAV